MNLRSLDSEQALSTEEMRDAVDVHLLRHIGGYETAFTDEEGWAGRSQEDGPPIDVLVVPPENERRFAYVTTFGCAFQPLPAECYERDGLEKRVEFALAAQQPGSEHSNLKALNLAANTVRQFAKMVHVSGVTVEAGETVAFSSDPKPVYDGASFCAFAFLPPRLPDPGFELLRVAETQTAKPVRYIAPVPIHLDELQYGIDKGARALLDLLMEAGVTEMIDLDRPSAVRRMAQLRAERAARRHGSPAAPPKRFESQGAWGAGLPDNISEKSAPGLRQPLSASEMTPPAVAAEPAPVQPGVTPGANVLRFKNNTVPIGEPDEPETGARPRAITRLDKANRFNSDRSRAAILQRILAMFGIR